MHKLNLANYTVKVKVPDAQNPGKLLDTVYPYGVKDSILNLLFTPDLQLTGAELVKQNALALKLEEFKGDVILLEDEEYIRIKRAVEAFKGFQRNDVQLVERINNAEKVEVEEK